MSYQVYKNFDSSRFSEELLSEIKKLGPLNKNINIFHNVCIEVLEKYASQKQKYINRANQANFMDSVISYVEIFRGNPYPLLWLLFTVKGFHLRVSGGVS